MASAEFSKICWHIECSTFTASSFSIWNGSTGIPLTPLTLFVVMLPKAHLTLLSRMSGSRINILEKGTATHSGILAQRIPWIVWGCRVKYNWVTYTHTHTHTHLLIYLFFLYLHSILFHIYAIFDLYFWVFRFWFFPITNSLRNIFLHTALCTYSIICCESIPRSGFVRRKEWACTFWWIMSGCPAERCQLKLSPKLCGTVNETGLHVDLSFLFSVQKHTLNSMYLKSLCTQVICFH